jgi:hypothetical protein
MIARDFTIAFPGSPVFDSLEAFFAWAKGRYQRAENSYERFDVVEKDDEAIVYVLGTVSGRLNDGSAFDAVRFVDRFVVRDRLIAKADAWSDMGDLMAKRARGGDG